MNIQSEDHTLRVSGISQLGADNATKIRDEVQDALRDGQKDIELDLSETTFLDSCGVGALVSLHKTAAGRNGSLRLLNPQPPVRQILDLTRMSQIIEIVKR